MKDKPTDRPGAINFSIVIPTRDRPRSLQACLDALAALDYPKQHYEVIVVDDSSTSPLDELIRRFEDRLQIALLRQVNAGPASARNVGANVATGRFIAFTDDDCVPAVDWLHKLEKRFSEQPECAVAGRTVNGLTQNIYATTSQMLIDYLFDHYSERSRQLNFATSSNLAFPRAAFIALGGFDRGFPLAAAEDRELCDRWNFASKTVVYAPEVRVQHFHQMNFWNFLRQHRNYGRGAFLYHRVRARRNAEPIRIEPLSFYLSMLRYPHGRCPLAQALGISVLLALTQFMNVVGFFQQRRAEPKQVCACIK